MEMELGTSGWSKLNIRSQNFLIEADFTWSRQHSEFVKHEKDFSSAASDYPKAVEAELWRRLDWLPASPLFEHYLKRKPGKRLALGELVRTLHEKSALDEQLLLQIVKAGVRCQDNRELMKQLQKLGNLRNKAAHPGAVPFSLMDYTELKEVVSKLMPDFVASLD